MIANIQIDTTGQCGSKCWYCPVRYYERPPHTIMSESVFDSILDSARCLEPKPGIWLAAYNDILLDPKLSSRLKSIRHHGFHIAIITNGLGLWSNLDLLYEYRDVIVSYSIDFPAGNEEDYSRFTLNTPLAFRRIVDGIKGLYEKNPSYYSNLIHINVNGVYDDEYARNQLKFPMPIGDTDKQINQLRDSFPELKINGARPLCDRAGLLAPYAIDNSTYPCRSNWRLPEGAATISGCGGGDRLEKWIHIASNGDMFLCCQDYKQETTYGNIADGILDVYLSSNRQDQIHKAMTGMCLKCQFAY